MQGPGHLLRNLHNRITMTQEQITQAIKSSKALQIYDLPNITPFEEYTPKELENITYIYINPDDQNWQPGYEKEIPAKAELYRAGDITLNGQSIPVYIY